LRRFLATVGDGRAAGVRVMAKIETRQAVDAIDAIAAVSDALKVARGDLWSELEQPWAISRVTARRTT
jgi:pyruvate kinase